VKRTIDSDIWTDDDFMDLSTNAKLLLLGIMTKVNDVGELPANPVMLNSRIMVGIEEITSTKHTMSLISELVEGEFIELYDNELDKPWLRLAPRWIGKRVGALDKDAYGYKWKGLSGDARRRDGYRCTKCGKSEGRLIAHHIKPLGHGGKNELDNLTTLCPGCHRIAHAELGDF